MQMKALNVSFVHMQNDGRQKNQRKFQNPMKQSKKTLITWLASSLA